MTLRSGILILICFIASLTGCSRKQAVTCGLGTLMNRPSIESSVLSLKSVGIADTTVAFISGIVTGKDSIDDRMIIDTLPFTAITFISRETLEAYSINSDVNGKFQRNLTAGTYNILFSFVGHNSLRIENVTLGAGELKELNVQLGEGFKETTIINGQEIATVDCVVAFDTILGRNIFKFVDSMPEYIGGNAALLKFFHNNFVYPKEQQNDFQASIYATFIIEPDGNPGNVDISKKYYGNALSMVEKEAIRVLRLMPAWIPGKCNGQAVAVRMNLPVKF